MQNAAGGSACGDPTMAVIASDPGNMRKIQPRIVSRLVSLLGVRSNSLNREFVGPLVQEIVVTVGIAGVDSDAKYKGMKVSSKAIIISCSQSSIPKKRRPRSIATRCKNSLRPSSNKLLTR
jgi:hypothetical protein